MRFSSSLYPYQEEILKIFESEKEKGEKKIHIVAPPGSGKTILGCEMLIRIAKPALILVPNLTLQEQWQDKLEKLFFEDGESGNSLISTTIEEIKYINILTYQSLAGSTDESDDIQEEIYSLWYESEKNEFSSKDIFFDFLTELKLQAPEEFKETYTRHRKRLKNSGASNTTRKMMREKIFAYTKQLKEYGVSTMIVDEAHHLTSWWSHVLFEIWRELDEPYIIGPTATPPFDDVDYFELDESYTKLLGMVDYLVPTPAIVKSGRLAPYSDLLYFVSPGKDLEETLKNREQQLATFLDKNKDTIALFLHTFLGENYERLKVKSGAMCDTWMRFIYRYKTPSIDMTPYIHGGITDTLSLEDIAKSVGKWVNDSLRKDFNSESFVAVKSLFFDLGYIWRGANFYRFETPLEKGLIYAKSKIEGVLAIVKKEEENLGSQLRIAIITDFLDAESDWLNCHSIFDAVREHFTHLSPYIVSGQGIWKIENGVKVLAENETILTVTEKLAKGETHLVIGTRGILGEGWDCPKLNTLIDLTGVSAYMSVNQVHGRAIRLDREDSEKVANIYDIVCIGEGYQGLRDFERIRKKHEQFYGVDDAGLVIKGVDHIYPQLEKNVRNMEKMNAYALKKSGLRMMMKELWNIGEEFRNEEIFSLSLEIMNPFEVYPLNTTSDFFELLRMNPSIESSTNMLELGKTRYHKLIRAWVRKITDATLQVLQSEKIIPMDFHYSLTHQENGSMTILSDYKDALVAKHFLEILCEIFDPITDQKYKFHFETNMKQVLQNLGNALPLLGIPLSALSVVTVGTVISGIAPGILMTEWIGVGIGLTALMGPWIGVSTYIRKKAGGYKNLKDYSIELPLPSSISSNEEKRSIFLGKKNPKGWRWKFRKITKLEGMILPVKASDVGQPTLFSAKIEKLWI